MRMTLEDMGLLDDVMTPICGKRLHNAKRCRHYKANACKYNCKAETMILEDSNSQYEFKYDFSPNHRSDDELNDMYEQHQYDELIAKLEA